MENEQAAQSTGAGEERQPYEAPELTVYGSVAELTQQTGGGGDDGLIGSVIVP
jgi:hypothetical protein